MISQADVCGPAGADPYRTSDAHERIPTGAPSSNEPASSHPPQKPSKPLVDSTPNLTPPAVDHRETPALTHQPGGDNPRPWFREFRSPPRIEFHVKEPSAEPLIGQKPSPSPLQSQCRCGGYSV